MTIPKGLIIYRSKSYIKEYRCKVLKYGLELNFIDNNYCSPKGRSILKKILNNKRSKRLISSYFSYQFDWNQNHLKINFKRFSTLRKLELGFHTEFEYDFYKSESSADSQFAVSSDREETLEKESDSLTFEENNKVTAKRIFKQGKKIHDLSIYFSKIIPPHDRIFHNLSLLNNLKNLSIKIDIRSPDDILSLKTLVKAAKQRTYWPNIKSLILRLRYSYNKQNCTSRFIDFCQNLQDIARIIKGSSWIKIKLKITYMNRLKGLPPLIKLQETLEQIPQLIVLSLVLDTFFKDLTLLVKAIKKMKNLRSYSMRFNEPNQVLCDIVESLSKLKSLRTIKISGKDILLRKGSENYQNLLQSLGGLSQITCFKLKGDNQTIDPISWSLFSQSIFRLSQLEVLIFKSQIRDAIEEEIKFEEFFIELKKLKNLKSLNFDIDNYRNLLKNSGSKVFPAFCQSLQSLQKLEIIRFIFPWKYSADSDLNHLINALPYLPNLLWFSLYFSPLKTDQAVETDTLMKLSTVLQGLKRMENFKLNMELKEVCQSTYEILRPLCKHFQERNATLELRIESSDQRYEQVHRKMKELFGQIYL